MCGILISPKSINNFEKRFDLISHRGIESRIVTTPNLFLGHHRLPLQTEMGDNFDQPIQIGKFSYVLFNGEIFNYHEFGDYRNDVDYLKHIFMKLESISDPKKMREYVLNIVKEKSVLWDGFWAIAIIIKDEDVFLFTDCLGKKQLYLSWKNGISSEIKPLLGRDYVLNQKAISKSYTISKNNYQSYDISPDSKNLEYFTGVFKADPGTLYHIKVKREQEEIFLDLNYKSSPLKDLFFNIPLGEEDNLRYLIRESISDRMVNKLNTNTILFSAGLDSSIIAYEIIQMDLQHRCNFIFIENSEDEIYVSKFEKDFGIKVKRISPSESEDYMFWYESPIDLGSVKKQFDLFSSIPYYSSVVITGDGADELFGGYRRSEFVDSFDYDVFTELKNYHHVRVDRASMRYTKECRNPFLSSKIISYAKKLPWEERINKSHLKKIYEGKLPDYILNRSKTPLRDPKMDINRIEFRNSNINSFTNIFESDGSRNKVG